LNGKVSPQEQEIGDIMHALGSVVDILWITGGTAFSLALLTAVIIWAVREHPSRDDTSPNVPTARPLAARPIEPEPPNQDA